MLLKILKIVINISKFVVFFFIVRYWNTSLFLLIVQFGVSLLLSVSEPLIFIHVYYERDHGYFFRYQLLCRLWELYCNPRDKDVKWKHNVRWLGILKRNSIQVIYRLVHWINWINWIVSRLRACGFLPGFVHILM